MIKPRPPNPDAVEFQQAAKTLPHDDFLQPSDMISPSNPTTTLANQDPSNPPAALTVVLSVACGAVATCILVTVRSTPQKNRKEPLPLTHYLGNSYPDCSVAPAPSLLQAAFPPRRSCLVRCGSSCSRQSSIPRRRGARRLFRWHCPRSQLARRRRGVSSYLAQQISLFDSGHRRSRTCSIPHVSQTRPS